MNPCLYLPEVIRLRGHGWHQGDGMLRPVAHRVFLANALEAFLQQVPLHSLFLSEPPTAVYRY